MVRVLSWVAGIAMVGLMVTTGIGCARCGETIAERAVERVAEQVTGADEISIGGRGKPVDLSELPAFLKYPGATATHSAKVSADDTRHWQYYFESGDSPSKIADWFERGFTNQGWKEPVKVESGDVTQIHYRSPDEKEMVSVTISSDNGKTSIMMQSFRETK